MLPTDDVLAPVSHNIGIIAILRGITPVESVTALHSLVDAGITTIEVPLNSPDPLESIARMKDAAPEYVTVGAGTVTTVQSVKDAHAVGANIIVAPNTDSDVIQAARQLDMQVFPGVATPSEAFTALHAGATGIKLFPCDSIGTAGLKAWKSVLPRDTVTIPVGGVSATNLHNWVDAGAAGAGIGGSLYRAGDDVGAALKTKAQELSTAWTAATAQ
jgi:2-dehydro-3-deoxyphosphogalactonate aldolase